MDSDYIDNNGSLNEENDEEICPLCMELLDETDRNLFPCNCGYQLCLWCLHYIRNTMGNKCPACRQDYNESNFKYITTSSSTTTASGTNAKDKGVGLKKKKYELNSNSSPTNNSSSPPISSHNGNASGNSTGSTSGPPTNLSIEELKDIRVIQRNLVYVVGIPLKLAKKEILKKYEYFGQYGKIQHIVVNKSTTYSNVNIPSYTAYITYSKKSEANYAIQCINTKQIDNKYLRASYGTTKYCSYFLKGLKCFNQDCYYLHKLTNESEHYYKNTNTHSNNTNGATSSATKDALKEGSTPSSSTSKEKETHPIPSSGSNTWVNIVNGISSMNSGLGATTHGSNSEERGDRNIFNMNIKSLLSKYNNYNKLININVVNNKNNVLDNNVLHLYQWFYNTDNTTDKPSSGKRYNGNISNDSEELFVNNELYINEIMNKIRRHTMLIDNLSKSYNTNNTDSNGGATTNSDTNSRNPNTIESYIHNILYNNASNTTLRGHAGDLTNGVNNVDTTDLNKLYKLQMKRNEYLLNHLKLISDE